MGVIDRTLASFVAAARTRLIGPDPVPTESPIDARYPYAAPAADVVDNPNVLAASSRGLIGELLYSTGALYNAVTGVGTSRDTSYFNQWATARPLRRGELYGMGRNGLIVQALSKLPNTATREGWRVEITDETIEERGKLADQIAAYEARLGIGHHCARALTKGRQYGEAMVVLMIDDGRAMSEPVDTANIRTIRWAAPIDVRYYQPATLYQAGDEKFGQVEKFRITDVNGFLEDGLRYGPNSLSFMVTSLDAERRQSGGEIIVHADRVLHFPTIDYLPLLDTLQDSFGAFFESMNGIRTAARESSVVVYKVSSWLRKMWSENAGLAQQHMRTVDASKSSMNAWVLDRDNEDVQVTSRSLGGVADLANPFMVWLGAALAMPQTILFGVSPGGFGKGEAETETWHNEARAYFAAAVAPRLHPLHGYILAAQDGCRLPYDTQRTISLNDLSPPDEEVRSKLRSEALSDIRQLVKDDILTRREVRPAVASLVDDYFRPEVDLDAQDDAPLAPVGVFTGAIQLMQVLYPGGVPVLAGRELMQALASTYFNAENTPRIFPELSTLLAAAAPTPPNPSTPGTAPAQPPPISSDEEDAAAESDLRYSESTPPADAMPPKDVCSALDPQWGTRPLNLTLAAKAGKLTPYRNPLTGKTLYSLAEVKSLHVGEPTATAPASATTPTATPATDHGPRSLCVALKLPTEFARFVPYKAEDLSAPHVTLLYVSDVDPQDIDAVLAELHATFAEIAPFDVTYTGKVDYFDTPAGKSARVAYAETEFSTNAQALFDDLAEGVEAFGLAASRHADGYTPHTTLAYLPRPGEVYSGAVPKGTWLATHAVVWYGDEEYDAFPLQGDGTNADIDTDNADRVQDKAAPTTAYWIWRTQKDTHVRKAHKRLEGRRYREGDKHPSQGEPGDAANCRCAKEIFVPPDGTKRAHAAAERTVRRALLRNYKRVSAPAIERAQAEQAGSARDLAEPSRETIYQWLREHYCMAPKLTRPRIEALLRLRDAYPFLRPPAVERVYRGLSNVKPSLVGKLLAETDPVRDKCWTTDIAEACRFAAGEYIRPEDVDPEAIGVVLIAEADADLLVLNAAKIADIPEVGEHFNPIWNMPIAESIRREAEVLAHGSLRVVQVRAVIMRSSPSTLTLDEAEAAVQAHWALAFDYESGGPLLTIADETDRALLRQVYALNAKAADIHARDADLSDAAKGAKEERIAEAFKRYHETVNMGAAELSEWAKTEWSKQASLSDAPIDRNLTLLSTPREEWTLQHATSAMRTVSFVARMRKAEQGEPVKINGREGPSRRDISLKNWAFDPAK